MPIDPKTQDFRTKLEVVLFLIVTVSIRQSGCASILVLTNVSDSFLSVILKQDEVLYEINASSENWMLAGRKRGYVSLSTKQGTWIS